MSGFDLWEPWVYWRFDLDFIVHRLAIGLDLFGAYGTWLWVFPIIWAIAAISLWGYLTWCRQQSDKAYLVDVSRRLPEFRRLAKERANEIVASGDSDRPW